MDLSELLLRLGSPHQLLVQDLGESTVYHYTDLNALQGIVGKRDLWLTNSRFSNDTEEGQHGRDIVVKAIAKCVEKPDSPAKMRKFAQGVGKQFAATDDDGVYVCCFCREDDLLSQWRSYGANGMGVSIGLRTEEFQLIGGPDTPSGVGLMYLWRVFYKEEKQLSIIDDCMRLAFNDSTSKLANRIALAVEAIHFFVPTFKNSAFKDEREARLIFRPAPECPVKPRFRVGRGMLVPYYELKELVDASGQNCWRPPISSVRIGPSAHRSINQQGVDLMLRSTGYSTVPVEVSNTPYRG